MSACRSCAAPVRFVKNDRERWMCLDDEPNDERGNVEIQGGVARVLSPAVAVMERNRGATLYLSHHATCPQREQWSRRP